MYTMLCFNNSDYRRNEYRAMKAIVIQNIKLQTILIMHKLYTSKEDCSDVIFNEDYSYSSVLVFNA